jgi:N-methylhydantoinase A/oxoprolinase/acetone carboxylase beta subunit
LAARTPTQCCWGTRVNAAVKTATTADVTGGIVEALRSLVREARPARMSVDGVMIGTTNFTNAVIEGKRLMETAAVRLGLPATRALPPLPCYRRPSRCAGSARAFGYDVDYRPAWSAVSGSEL